jgi:hypothetical protein
VKEDREEESKDVREETKNLLAKVQRERNPRICEVVEEHDRMCFEMEQAAYLQRTPFHDTRTKPHPNARRDGGKR